jgi:hypothetical protein
MPRLARTGQGAPRGSGAVLADTLKPRAMFLTFQMAEGINLQMASALGIIGVTSDVKSLIQGLGRIDRIDSPHSRIHYYTFDLSGLVLSSDRTARKRVANIAVLSGVGAEDLPSELVEFAAGDLTDLVLEQIRQPRILRKNNYFDQIENLHRVVPAEVIHRVRGAGPKGLWGADLCLLASKEPVTILMLAGRTGDPLDLAIQPPRLIAIRERDGQAEIVGDQAAAARLLAVAWAEAMVAHQYGREAGGPDCRATLEHQRARRWREVARTQPVAFVDNHRCRGARHSPKFQRLPWNARRAGAERIPAGATDGGAHRRAVCLIRHKSRSSPSPKCSQLLGSLERCA